MSWYKCDGSVLMMTNRGRLSMLLTRKCPLFHPKLCRFHFLTRCSFTMPLTRGEIHVSSQQLIWFTSERTTSPTCRRELHRYYHFRENAIKHYCWEPFFQYSVFYIVNGFHLSTYETKVYSGRNTLK
jgi:hypothetical protein